MEGRPRVLLAHQFQVGLGLEAALGREGRARVEAGRVPAADLDVVGRGCADRHIAVRGQRHLEQDLVQPRLDRGDLAVELLDRRLQLGRAVLELLELGLDPHPVGAGRRLELPRELADLRAQLLLDLLLLGPEPLVLRLAAALLLIKGHESVDVGGDALGLGAELETGRVLAQLLQVDHGAKSIPNPGPAGPGERPR